MKELSWNESAKSFHRAVFPFRLVRPNIRYIIVLRNGKISGNTGRIVVIFTWTWNLNLNFEIWIFTWYLGWPYREYIKTAKNGAFCEELLSESDFAAVLAIFCFYDYGANASQAVHKIATDQRASQKLTKVPRGL